MISFHFLTTGQSFLYILNPVIFQLLWQPLSLGVSLYTILPGQFNGEISLGYINCGAPQHNDNLLNI